MKHILISFALAASLVSASVQAGPISYLDSEQRVAAFGDNVYRYVVSPLDWNAALAAASTYSWNGQAGHLLTVTSQGENDFIYSAFVGPRFATPGANVEQATPWIALSDRETEGLWKWMAGPETGAAATFTNWNYGEPNNLGDEDYAVLHWQDRGLGTGRWYDYGVLGYGGQTFVVEFENAVNPSPVPVPATLPLLASALAGFGVWRRRAFRARKRLSLRLRLLSIFALAIGPALSAQAIPALTSIQLGAFNSGGSEWACWGSPNGCGYEVFIAEGSTAGTLINANHTLNAELGAGSHTFYLFGDYDYNNAVRDVATQPFTLRLSFDGRPMQGFINASPGYQDIAVRSPLNNSGTLFASNPLQSPYAGSLAYQTANWVVSLTDFNLTMSFEIPSGFDRVAPNSVGANGRQDAVGSFTLNVQPVPVPATLPLLASALAGFCAWRRRASGQH